MPRGSRVKIEARIEEGTIMQRVGLIHVRTVADLLDDREEN